MNNSIKQTNEHSQYGRDIFHFNKMLRSGRMSRRDCYRWLEKKQMLREQDFKKEHGFEKNLSFYYLYPEIMGPLPDTYEEWSTNINN